jgi:hypothetical protein
MASLGSNAADATSAMPAVCASVINGMAAKLTRRPAKVTRENRRAATGSNAASAHTEASRSAAAGRAHRGPRRQSRAHCAPITIPVVAPNVSRKPASKSANGL